MGLLAEVEGWHQALVAFAVVWPPLSGHQVAGSVQTEWWYHAYTNDSTESRFKVEVTAPLVLLCLLCVYDTLMGINTVFFPRLKGDYNILQSISLDFI